MWMNASRTMEVVRTHALTRMGPLSVDVTRKDSGYRRINGVVKVIHSNMCLRPDSNALFIAHHF